MNYNPIIARGSNREFNLAMHVRKASRANMWLVIARNARGPRQRDHARSVARQDAEDARYWFSRWAYAS